ncbi:hypothetical protein H0H93_000966 [Arthromyces matolae]|nr:hypothetical protein H0H93_000966 [Arthromyces matolae]
MKVKIAKLVAIIILSTFLLPTYSFRTSGESKSLNLQSVPDTRARRLPDKISEEDIAETYIEFLRTRRRRRLHPGFIEDKRDQIYRGGNVIMNVAAFPYDWVNQEGKLYIPVWAKDCFQRAPRWHVPPRPSYPPKDYETIIQTDAPMWLHQLISPDWVTTALLDKHWETGFEYRWNLASSGRNVWVYVFDTGIDVKNPEFENRATNGWAFDGHLDYQDKYGHGTACASQIGGKTFGVAKKVNIVSIRVLNDDGCVLFYSFLVPVKLMRPLKYQYNFWKVDCDVRYDLRKSSIGPDLTKSVDGMKHVLHECQTHKQPCVISMSFTIFDNEMASAACTQAKTVAAGNNNSHIKTGIAGLPNVITVGALDPDRNYGPALFSNYGFVDIWAFGTDICALLITTPSLACELTGTTSGTSFHYSLQLTAFHKQAAAPIAGIVASLISLEGNLEPPHMKERIKRMAIYGKIPKLRAYLGGGHNLRAYIPPEIYTPAPHIQTYLSQA